jgi:peroxiredoxin
MIEIGSDAPDFALEDQFGRKVELSALKGKCNVLLLFYPLDWTPT